MNINNLREKVHGVITIYFIQPTEENLKKLNEDFGKDLYDAIYINFSTFVSIEYLNDLAKIAARNNVVYKIIQIYQHNLNFVSLNKEFFTLNISNIYEKLNKPNRDNSKLFDSISESLFSVFRCMKMIPSIMHQSGMGVELKTRLEVIIRIHFEYLLIF